MYNLLGFKWRVLLYDLHVHCTCQFSHRWHSENSQETTAAITACHVHISTSEFMNENTDTWISIACSNHPLYTKTTLVLLFIVKWQEYHRPKFAFHWHNILKSSVKMENKEFTFPWKIQNNLLCLSEASSKTRFDFWLDIPACSHNEGFILCAELSFTRPKGLIKTAAWWGASFVQNWLDTWGPALETHFGITNSPSMHHSGMQYSLIIPTLVRD